MPVLKLAILSRDSKLYSTKRLVEEARKQQHKVRVLDPLRCYLSVAPQALSLKYKGKSLSSFDAVIPRIGSSITYYGVTLVRQFELMKVVSLNSAAGISLARDKLACLQTLSAGLVNFPKTGFAQSPDDTHDLLELCGNSPVVIKLNDGSQGRGVVLAENDNTAEALIAAFRSQWVYLLVQKYISEANGKDIRCFVIGDQVVAAMERSAKPGDFRSNLHQGGSGTLVELDETERDVAIRAAKLMGLDVAGVDLIRSAHGCMVLEVNASPGLEGIEKVCGINIAGLIISHLENKVKSN